MVNGVVHNVGWPCVVGGWLGVTETAAGLGNKICYTYYHVMCFSSTLTDIDFLFVFGLFSYIFLYFFVLSFQAYLDTGNAVYFVFIFGSSFNN